MVWSSWEQFWSMGGSGQYVWSAYGIVALALVVEIVRLRLRMRQARELVRRNSAWPQRGANP